MKWIHVIILENISYVQYFYTQINNNQMQREPWFSIMLRSSLMFLIFKRRSRRLELRFVSEDEESALTGDLLHNSPEDVCIRTRFFECPALAQLLGNLFSAALPWQCSSAEPVSDRL